MPDPVSAIVAGTIGSGISNLIGIGSAKDDISKGVAAANAASKEMLDKGLSTQKDYFQQGTEALSPIAGLGKDIYGKLASRLDSLTSPIRFDQATLENTPGYQFNVRQGLRAIDLSAVSRGMSGAQAKAAAQFGVNTANTLYKDQFDMEMQNRQLALNALTGAAQIGTGAAGQLASNATSAGNVALAGATGTGNTIAGTDIKGAELTSKADAALGKTVGDTISGVSGLVAAKAPINKLYS